MTARSQRWRDRQDTFVPNATYIDPAELADAGMIVRRALGRGSSNIWGMKTPGSPK